MFLTGPVLAAGGDSAQAAASQAVELDTALAANELRVDSALAWCAKAFKELLPEATQALRSVPDHGHASTRKLVWIITESGGSSSLIVIEGSSPDAPCISVRGDDDRVDKRLSLKHARDLSDPWNQTMAGQVTDVRDIADGSRTLLADGKSARVFLPTKGVPGTSGDMLAATLHLIYDALDD